jgi:MarR family
MSDWRPLSTHGRVLVFVARHPHARLRDIADAAGITERTAHRIVSELVEDGYLVRQRSGRSNHYVVRPDVPIRHPLLGEHWVGEILAVLAGTDGWPARSQAARESG